MKTHLTFIFLFITTIGLAQKHNTYFVKNDGSYTDIRDSADYFRVISEPEMGSELYNVVEYYKSGKTKLIGKSSTIDPQTYEGEVINFYEDSAKKSIEKRIGNKLQSIQFFYPNGKLKELREYPDSLSKHNYYENYTIITYIDSTGKALVANGNGYFKGYENWYLGRYSEGKIVNGAREGIWKGGYPKENVTFIEEYQNGAILSGECTTNDNKKYSYKAEEVPPVLGNMENIFKEIQRSIYIPPGNGVNGTVIIKFVIDKSGSTRDFTLGRAPDYNIGTKVLKAITKVFAKTPGIIPGIQYGHPVNVGYNIPFRFNSNN